MRILYNDDGLRKGIVCSDKTLTLPLSKFGKAKSITIEDTADGKHTRKA
jgi:hypothetical protein